MSVKGLCVTNNYVTEFSFFIASEVIKRRACSNFKAYNGKHFVPFPLLLANYILSSEKEKNTKGEMEGNFQISETTNLLRKIKGNRDLKLQILIFESCD